MFFLVIILFTSFTIICASPNNNGRIVNGSDVNIADYPYMVSIGYLGFHTCGGAILNEDTVLTATHCVYRRNETRLHVRAGSDSRSSGGQLVNVAHVISHHDFVYDDLENDLTILKLEESLVFGVGVSSIQLPEPWSDIEGGTLGRISGWGTLYYTGPGSDLLQGVDVPVVDRDLCNQFYADDGGVDDRQICAGAKGLDACTNDSGGPLVVAGKHVGIISWGYRCAEYQRPTVFVRTSAYIDWIEQQLKYKIKRNH